jgi:hypothetical protein
VVIDSRWIRYEQSRKTDGAKLSHGQGTGTTDYEVRPRIRCCHVIDKWHELNLYIRFGVRGSSRFQGAGTALMTNDRPYVLRKLRQSGWYSRVQRQSTLTAAEHQQS